MTKTITRSDLIQKITLEVPITKQKAGLLLSNLFGNITDVLKEGKNVKISSFGTFVVHHKKERLGRNPRTGEEAVISPRRVVSFRPSPLMKKSILTKA
jgi:integration host factor subunit alpha